MAPIKSARIVKLPMHIPPKLAAMGIYLFRVCFKKSDLLPLTRVMFSLCSYLATSLTPAPLTSIQVLLNKAQVPSTNAI